MDSDMDSNLKNNKDDFQIQPGMFENLIWDIECTADVRKALSSNNTHIPPATRKNIVKRIFQLGSGEYTKDLFKKLKTRSENVILYEAKISKGSRLIWEDAIAFSQRLTDHTVLLSRNNHVSVYSQIIRIWDIVLDHKDIHQSVEKIVEKIEKSLSRGKACNIKKYLISKGDMFDNTKHKCPNMYVECSETDDMGLKKNALELFQPAHSSETEYGTMKFYSFSSGLAANIIKTIGTNVDYPFQVSDQEYKIISLSSNAPLVLIGRSGTGKTTCCLYRLWNTFKQYWNDPNRKALPLLPCPENCKPQTKSGQAVSKESNMITSDILVEEDDANGQVNHLHQIFITKNSVLCGEVQKNFQKFMLGHEELFANHIDMSNHDLPYRLQDLDDYQFPLFVTGRQFLLMLDASLDPPYYFARNVDGSPKCKIEGWMDQEDLSDILNVFEDTDSDLSDESTSDESSDDEHSAIHTNHKRYQKSIQNKMDPKKEVTYEVFKKCVWPKMSTEGCKYHPSLVWTEILSFLKGSYEAIMSTNGKLTETLYCEIGQKRAPVFNDERTHIYELFKRYEHVRKNKSLFDETDFVYNLYQRLVKQSQTKWTIHQIYVDETQDFTQAELYLLTQLCDFPCGLFMTGDTAQSIMRGISFRFSDLISLFHVNARKEKMEQNNISTIPKEIYQLTLNYRSHTGIVDLASSVIDLIAKLFPESIDKLKREQGFQPGPKPVFLESCQVDELPQTLIGNRRKTSHIEFGAHQAILVVDDTAKKNLPPVLNGSGVVLTIYEAKGLEFDDILIFNFFKNSQALKEWRVVTSLIQDLKAFKAKGNAFEEICVESLRGSNSRPLAFDPRQHKILNSELKQLYTAITRARVNVWIFDEDVEKRLPMFEFFKSLELIEVSSKKEFTKYSSAQEWITRGEEYMKKGFYSQAIHCFKKGECPKKETLASAYMYYEDAKDAIVVRKNKREMKIKFYKAAKIFFDLRQYRNVGKCLKNTGNLKLAAQLYEKRNEFEKAGEMYKELKNPLPSSDCYERAGCYNKALDVLLKYYMFDEAENVLNRYHQEAWQAVLHRRKIQKPRDNQTMNQIWSTAAEYYHRNRDPNRMLHFLNKEKSVQNRIDFLKTRHNSENQYINYAVEIVENADGVKEAALFCLRNGVFRKAINLFETSNDTVKIARCKVRLVRSEIATAKENPLHVEILKDAIQLCRSSHSDIGEAYFLLGYLTNERNYIQTAMYYFQSCKPKHEFGLLEYTKWIVQHTDLKDEVNLEKVICGLVNIFKVMHKLNHKNTDSFTQVLLHCDITTDKDYALFHPKSIPLMLAKLEKAITCVPRKSNDIEVKCPLPTVLNKIVLDLLAESINWHDNVVTNLYNKQLVSRWCFQHNQSEHMNGSNFLCSGLHTQVTADDFCKLIKSDILLVKIESIMYRERGLLKRLEKDKRSLRKKDERKEPFAHSRMFVNDVTQIIPCITDLFLTEHALKIKTLLSSFEGVSKHMCIFFKQSLSNIKSVLNSVGNYTHAVIEVLTCMKLFSVNIELDNILSTTEQTILKKFNEGNLTTTKARKCGFEIYQQDNRWSISSHVRVFVKSIDELTVERNPYSSIMHFKKFIEGSRIITSSSSSSQINNFLLWIRFFTVVGFSLQSKGSSQNQNFFIPSSFFSSVELIDLSISATTDCSTIDLIAKFNHESSFNLTKICKSLETLRDVTFGAKSHTNILKVVFKKLSTCCRSSADKDVFSQERNDIELLAQQILVLYMIFLVNIDDSQLSSSAPYIMVDIKPSFNYSNQMFVTLELLQNVRERDEIRQILTYFLETKGERMFQCKWDKTTEALSIVTLPNSVFSIKDYEEILQGRTMKPDAPSKEVEEEEEEEDEEEEVENDEEEGKEEENSNENETKVAIEEKDDYLLSVIDVNESHCDICGVVFKDDDEIQSNENQDEIRRILDTGVLGESRQAKTSLATVHLSEQKILKAASNTWLSNETNRTINLNLFSSHTRSASHIKKENAFLKFKNYFSNKIKPIVHNINQFISKYNLDVVNISDVFPDDNYRVENFLSNYKKFNSTLIDVKQKQLWSTNFDKELSKLQREMCAVEQSVKDNFNSSETTNNETLKEDDKPLEDLKYTVKDERKKKNKHGKVKTKWTVFNMTSSVAQV